MRLLPDHYASQSKPATLKRNAARVKHFSAPLKGLNLSSKLIEGDLSQAPILDNWVIEENCIRARAGTHLVYSHAAARPIFCLVPHYGDTSKLAAATNGELRLLDDTLVKSGFTSDDWHWTSFSNLSQTDFTVMCNGQDGVWSWTGGSKQVSAAIPVVSISKANPAVVTVAAADIVHFVDGMNVTIAGATGDFIVANGIHVIFNVGTPVNSFTLFGVDTSTATGTSPAGITVVGQGAMVKETITVNAADPWVSPDTFAIVVSHMNRLWFADNSNLAVYYLPIQQKAGEVNVLPLNAIFKRGGSIRAMYTWTIDGGMGLDDQLVIFSTNGECAIYSGIDPDTPDAFQLAGVFRFDSPMSKHSVAQYGGELYVLISTGLVPMSTMLRAESEQLGQGDRSVYSNFFQGSLNYRSSPGWSVMLNHSSGRMICNMPQGATNRYRQMVRFMPNPVWASWSGLPSRCWGWISNRVYFGSDDGKVYEIHPNYLNDDGQPIKVDVQMAWSSYNTPALKHFKMVLPFIVTDGSPKPYIDIKVDYDTSPPENQPETSFGVEGARWDVALWPEDPAAGADDTYWAIAERTRNNYSGIGRLGHVGAIRLTASLLDCSFTVTGFDVIYEPGSVFG